MMVRMNRYAIVASRTGLAALVSCAIAYSQSAANQSVEFDVAVVQRSPPPARGLGYTTFQGGPRSNDPGRIDFRYITLKTVLSIAYQASDFSIAGPGWIDEERFDFAATMPTGTTESQFRVMLQNLLRERFQLSAHREVREMQGYVLMMAKGGPKLGNTRAPDGTSLPGSPGFDADGFPLTPSGPGIYQACRSGRCRMRANQASVPELAEKVSNHLYSPVVDETQIEGKYDFTLTYDIVSAREKQESLGYDRSAPELATALRTQLGLTITPRKVPASVLVIDHIQKIPAEN
jgi:uncharacterized protein (TIGR03435 family)